MTRAQTLGCFLITASLCGVLAASCGGDGLGVGGDAGADLSASTDLAPDLSKNQQIVAIDLAGRDFAGVACGTQTCGTGEVCCVAVQGMSLSAMCVTGTTCGDGGIPAACDGPEDCGGATSNCCADISLAGGGMSINGMASCTATCPGSASAGGGGSGGMITTKLCHNSADCIGYTGTAPFIGNAPFDACCGTAMVPLKFCAPAQITLVASQITCN